MKRKMISIMLLLFLSSILVTTFAATENVIVRVGYPRSGENQYVGTVRIYESDATIDSIQKGDVFTIFLDNAEFITPPTLVERGRFDLKILSGGNDGDSYVTYEFLDASPSRTGRVIIDFEFDDMRVFSGDVTARVDSVQSGVSNGYFSLDGSQEKETEKPKINEEEVIITNEQLKEAEEKKVNILVRNNEYQIVIPNDILEEKKMQKVLKDNENLKIKIKREKPSESKYLTDTYFMEFIIIDNEGNNIGAIEDFDHHFYLKIKDPEIKDKRNVKGNLIKESQDLILFAHYDVVNDFIMIQVDDFSNKITLLRGSNYRDLIFEEDDYTVLENEKYVPLRKSASYYGWNVTWNPFTRIVNLEKGEHIVEVKDYVIAKERSYVSTDFLRENLNVSIFELDNQVALKYD